MASRWAVAGCAASLLLSGPSFLSTHPVDAHRISELQRHLPQALAEYQQARR